MTENEKMDLLLLEIRSTEADMQSLRANIERLDKR